MSAALLLGALAGAITGPIALLAWRAWERRRHPLKSVGINAGAWTERTLFRGQR